MENSASRVSSSPQGEIRIFVKSKNASPELAKEIRPTPVVVKEVPRIRTNTSNQSVSMRTRSREILNTVSKYELKKILQSRFSRNTITNWGTPRTPYLQKKESAIGKKIMPFAFSVLGAVLVGVVMGLSILSLFFSNHSNQSGYTIDSHLPKTKLENQIISLPPLRIVMLQAGIFSEQESAQKAVEQLRARGIGAVMSSVSPFRVFLGLAPSDEEAGKLVSVYKKENVDVYQRELDTADKVGLTSNQKKLETVIKTGNYLLTELSKRSSNGILTSSSIPLNSEMTQSYKRFCQGAQAVLPYLPVQARAKLTEMQNALNQAVQSVSSVERVPSQSTLWKVQEGLVRYVTAYEKLISILAVR